jgi:hypothetical protein
VNPFLRLEILTALQVGVLANQTCEETADALMHLLSTEIIGYRIEDRVYHPADVTLIYRRRSLAGDMSDVLAHAIETGTPVVPLAADIKAVSR